MKTNPIASLITIVTLVLTAGMLMAQEPKRTPVSFALFTAATSPESVKALTGLLLSGEGNSVTAAATFQEGIASTADILVVMMEKADFKALGEYHVEALKRRKAIGIGYGAAKIFEEAGLKISAGHCAHGVPGEPRIMIEKNRLLDQEKFPGPFSLFDPPMIEGNFHNAILFGIHVGPKKPQNRDGIDIVALFTTDREYAPITRQNYTVLIGVNGHVAQWSPPFRKFVLELGAALAR